MGFAPPPDLPPPPSPPPVPKLPFDPSALQATFNLSPPVVALCGFVLPLPSVVFGIKLPSPLPFPPPIPTIKLAIGLNCSLSNPLDISAGIDFGGGRVGNAPPDPDLAFDQAA